MPLDRVLEVEVMDTPEESRDYDAMDHATVNRVFVRDGVTALAVIPTSPRLAKPRVNPIRPILETRYAIMVDIAAFTVDDAILTMRP